MAVIDTFYAVQRPDVGRPALVQFWEAFIGTRSKINQQVMADRLRQEDPQQLAKLEGQIRDNIADLHKTRGEITKMQVQLSKETDTNRIKLLTTIISAHAKMQAAKTTASATLGSAKIRGRADVATEILKVGEKQRRPYEEKMIDPMVRGAMQRADSAAKATGNLGEKFGAYQGYIGALRADTARGSAEDLAVIRAAIDHARASDDPAGKSIAVALESEYLRDRQPGENLDAYFSRKLGVPTEEHGRRLADEITRAGIAGGSLDELISTVLPQLGWSAGEIEPYQRAVVGVEVRAPAGAPEPGLEVATTPQGQTAIGSLTADIDRQIKALEDEAKRLQTRRAAVRPPNRFSYVMSNALLDPALVVPPREGRPAFEAMEMLSPEQRVRASELVSRAGGDPQKALELLRQEQAAAEMPPEEAVQWAEVPPTIEPIQQQPAQPIEWAPVPPTIEPAVPASPEAEALPRIYPSTRRRTR